jgi:hypothetical protein
MPTRCFIHHITLPLKVPRGANRVTNMPRICGTHGLSPCFALSLGRFESLRARQTFRPLHACTPSVAVLADVIRRSRRVVCTQMATDAGPARCVSSTLKTTPISPTNFAFPSHTAWT